MDFALGAAGGSGDEPNQDQNFNKGKKSYRRHNSDQTTKLEE